MDHGRFSRGGGTLQGRCELGDGFDEFTVAPHGDGHLIVAYRGVIVAEPGRFAAELALLGAFLHAVGPVHGHQDDDREVVTHSGFQLLKIEAERAVARDAVDGPFRAGQLGPETVGQARAQVPVVHGVDHRARPSGHMVMNVPQGRIATVHHKDGVIAEEGVAGPENLAGQHGPVRGVFECGGQFLIELILKGPEFGHLRMGLSFPRQWPHRLQKLVQNGAGISDQGDVRRPVEADVGGFGIDLDQALLFGLPEHGGAPPHVQFPQARAHRQDDVGLAVGRDAGHAGRMKAQGMVVGDNAARPYRVGDRATQVFGQAADRLGRAGALRAVAAVNVDQVGLDQHLSRLLGCFGIGGQPRGQSIVGRGLDRHAGFIPLEGDDILGDQDMRRSGAAAQGHAESVPHHVGDTLPVFHLAVPFDRRLENLQMTADLHAPLLQVGIGDIAAPGRGDRHHRAALGLGAHHAGEQIGGPGTGAGHGHRRFPADPGVGVAGMRGGSLVPGNDQAYIELFSQPLERFDDHHIGAVRDGVKMPHPFGVQAFQQQFASCDLRHNTSSDCRSCGVYRPGRRLRVGWGAAAKARVPSAGRR